MGERIIDGVKCFDSATEDPNSCVNVSETPSWALEEHMQALETLNTPCPFCKARRLECENGEDGLPHIVSGGAAGSMGSSPLTTTGANKSAGQSQSVGSKVSSAASHLSRGLISSGASQTMNSVTGGRGGGSLSSSMKSSGSRRRQDPKTRVSPEHAKPSRRLSAGFGAYIESRSKQMVQRSTGDSIQDLLDPQLFGNKDISPFSGRNRMASYGPTFDTSVVPELENKLEMAQSNRRELLHQGKSVEEIQPEQNEIKAIRVELQQARVKYDSYIERADYTEYDGTELQGIVNSIKECDRNIDDIADQMSAAQEKLHSLGREGADQSEMESTRLAISGLQYDLQDQMGRRSSNIGEFKSSLQKGN